MTTFHIGLVIAGALVVELVYVTLANRGPLIWLMNKRKR
jgi:hypothetical protein